ncbi:MAG: ABC transporter permease [Metamycoplasmataceae bacterium]
MQNNNIFSTFTSYFKSDKQSTGRQKLYSTIWALIASFLLVAFILIIVGVNPFSFFIKIIEVAFGEITLPKLLFLISIYIFATLAIAICFKIGLFNISISSQILISALLTLAIVNSNPGNNGSIILALFISMLSSIFISLLIGILKVYFKINEVISSILLNWSFLYIAKTILINFKFLQSPSDGGAGSSTATLNISNFFSTNEWSYIILGVSIFFIVIVWFVMKKTVIGYKINVLGTNKDAAHYSGTNEKRYILSIMFFSGVLAGIAGFLFILKESSFSIGSQPLPIGFDTIAITLLANNNPIGIFFSSSLYSILNANIGLVIQDFRPNINTDFYQIIVGIIIYFTSIIIVFEKFKVWTFLKNYFLILISKEGRENFALKIKMEKKAFLSYVKSFSIKQKIKKNNKENWKKINQNYVDDVNKLKLSYYDNYLNSLNELNRNSKYIFDFNLNLENIKLYFSLLFQKPEKASKIKEKIAINKEKSFSIKKWFSFQKEKHRIKSLIKNQKIDINFLNDDDKLEYYLELNNLKKKKDFALSDSKYFTINETKSQAISMFKNSKRNFKKNNEKIILLKKDFKLNLKQINIEASSLFTKKNILILLVPNIFIKLKFKIILEKLEQEKKDYFINKKNICVDENKKNLSKINVSFKKEAINV